MLDVLNIWKREAEMEMMSPFQEEVIRHVMRRRDALVVMPPGPDRDFCFQVPSMLMKGYTLVISPRFREHREERTLYIQPSRLGKALAWLRNKSVSLFVIDEVQCMCSWWKHNKKLMNAGELKPERLEMFKQLLGLGEKYRRKNQYA